MAGRRGLWQGEGQFQGLESEAGYPKSKCPGIRGVMTLGAGLSMITFPLSSGSPGSLRSKLNSNHPRIGKFLDV